MTRELFLTAYRKQLLHRYTWAADATKLDRFMQSVQETLSGGNTWNHDGEAVTTAWKVIGGKGKPTKKALRALT
jgi:hypothetical protein